MAPPPAPWRNGGCAQVWLPVRLGIERLTFAQKNTHELSRLCVAGGDLSVNLITCRSDSARGDATEAQAMARRSGTVAPRACRLRATLKLIVMA